MYENYRAAMNSIENKLIVFVSFCIQKIIVCRYWELILKDIRFLKNLIAADCRADRNGHFQAVLDLIQCNWNKTSKGHRKVLMDY